MKEFSGNGREPKWGKNDLERRLCHALDIARLAVEHLAAQGYKDPAEPVNDIRPEKVISETAFLLLAASSAAHSDQVGERIDRVARLLIPYARSERILFGICVQPALALDYAQAHVCLVKLGYPDQCFDKLLRQCASSQAWAGRERVPHRILEQEWITNLWNNSRSASTQASSAAARNSVLNQSTDLLGSARDDVYAFTHALMYVRDFNIRPLRLPRRRAKILSEAEAMLARCLDDEDYDLGGEVLLTWPLTGKSWSAASTFGFRVLTHVEDSAGFLPSPSTRLERLKTLEGDKRTNYLLATAYHTIYVMGLLCAAALQPGRTPPSVIPTTAAARGRANLILPFLDADGRRNQWRSEFDKLIDPERDAIAGLLLNIALRRKASQKQFGAVRELLEIGRALGMSDTPASSQAAEMLERLATFASFKTPTRRDASNGTIRAQSP